MIDQFRCRKNLLFRIYSLMKLTPSFVDESLFCLKRTGVQFGHRLLQVQKISFAEKDASLLKTINLLKLRWISHASKVKI